MNRQFFMLLVSLVLVMPQAWGASSQYPDPYRQTMWNNITDSVHTWGQSPRQAAFTKSALHNARAQARFKSIKDAKRKAWMQGQ